MKKWCGNLIYKDTCNSHEYTYFRKEFDYTPCETPTILSISAEICFKLYINGEYVKMGPLRSQPYNKYYEDIDITSMLKEGKNCIGVVVYYYGECKDKIDVGMLLCQAENDKVIVKTDGTWKYKVAEAWDTIGQKASLNQYFPYQEFYNANKFIDDFSVAGYEEDYTWNYTKVLVGDFGATLPPAVPPFVNFTKRCIPEMESTTKLPLEIVEVGECISLITRANLGDLSIALSLPGKKLEYATMENANSLLSGDGIATFTTSRNHEEHHDFDGFYDPYIVLDFGKVEAGYIELEVESTAGQFIDVGYSERLINGTFSNSIECQFADRYTTKDGNQVYKFWSWRSFKYAKIMFRSAFKGIKVKRINLVTSYYPYNNEEHSFSSNNETINKLFEAARHTVRLCANEFFMDTPGREQAQWIGDTSGVTMPCVRAMFNDNRLELKYHSQVARNQMIGGLVPSTTNKMGISWQKTIVDFVLWWIESINDTYMYNNDIEVVHTYYHNVLQALSFYENFIDEDGLISDLPFWTFIDWANIDREGKSGVLNALFYKTLHTIRSFAELRNDQYVIDKTTKYITNIKNSFFKTFYNEERGCFVDNVIDGVQSNRNCEHVNVMAILSGLCIDKDILNGIMDKFYGENPIPYECVQPFFARFAAKMLLKVDKREIIYNKLIKKWIVYMIDKGHKTMNEEWTNSISYRFDECYGIMRTRSHAWSAYPVEFFLHDVVGFKIEKAGCTEISFCPINVDFDFDSHFCIPQGKITVHKVGDKYTITAPKSVKVSYDESKLTLIQE